MLDQIWATASQAIEAGLATAKHWIDTGNLDRDPNRRSRQSLNIPSTLLLLDRTSVRVTICLCNVRTIQKGTLSELQQMRTAPISLETDVQHIG